MLKVRILAPIISTGTRDLVGEYRIESANIKRSMKEFAHFSFEIKAEDLTNDFDLANPLIPIFAEIYKDDVQYIEGYVINVRYQRTKIIVECEDILYRYTWVGLEDQFTSSTELAWTLFNNVQTLAILFEIGMPLGNFFYWEDPHIAINFDMRELEVLTDAWYKLSDTVGKTTYYQFQKRKAMVVSDQPLALVDVGTFEKNTRFQYNENNILDIEINKPHEPTLELVYVYGGTYENPAGTVQIIRPDTGTIAAQALDADYSQTNQYVELNTIPPNSSYFREKVIYVDADVQTKISPGVNQRNRASTTAYREAVRVLKESGINDATEELQISSNVMPLNLMPGNIVNVNYDFKYPVFVPGLNKTVDKYMGNNNINGDYYVQDYDLTLYENDLDINMTLKTEKSYKDTEPAKLTKKQIKQIKKNKEYFVTREAAAGDLSIIGLYDVTISGVAANTTLLGNPARSTVISKIGAANFGNATSTPISSTDVLWFYICTDPEYEERTNLEWAVQPSTAANFTIVTQFDDNWTVNDSVRVKMLLVFET